MSMVLKLLAESVRQTGIAPHPHPHRKIAAFHERRTDVFRIGLAAQHPGTASDAGCGAITRFRAVSGGAVQFDQHGVVNLRAESVLHGIGINAMPISCELNPIDDTRSCIAHERLRCFGSKIPERVGHNQFAVAVQCRPRPNAAKATLYLFQGQILILTANKRPYLIALQPTNAHVADMRVMVSSASTPQIVQESENGVFADAQHPARSVDGIAFHQCTHDGSLFGYGQTIHGNSNIRYRSRISQDKNALDFVTAHVYNSSMTKKRKNPYAVALGRKGGRKGGPARAANMTPQERSESARNAVLARWAKVKQENDR